MKKLLMLLIVAFAIYGCENAKEKKENQEEVLIDTTFIEEVEKKADEVNKKAKELNDELDELINEL
jgi:uncharacterized protein YcfL